MTLVEVMLGIFMIALLSLAVLGLMTASEKVNRQAEARSIALSAARQQLEAIAGQNPLNRRPVTDQAFTIPDSVQALLREAGVDKLSGEYTVRNVNGNAELQQIEVRVFWGNYSSPNRRTTPISQVRLSRLVASEMNTTWRNTGNRETDVFVDPPPPPQPPPPVQVSGGGNTGSTGSNNGGNSNGGSSGGSSTTTSSSGGSNGGSNTGSNGGSSSGGSTGGTSGGGGFSFNIYGSQWR